ncbi:MAG: ATP-binding protein, partial [Bacteroidales bacterium]|nr:ATP-binding protein [Bacteroidales bacterium]
HIPQIKKALGIDRIGTEHYSWRSSDPSQKAQVDLIIERADRIINLCEIKYSEATYTINKTEDLKLRKRQAVFVDQTGTPYGIMPTFITTYGLTQNGYASNIMNEVTMDDLFKE